MKPRYLKAISTINHEPDKWSSQYQKILLMEIAGASGGEISKLVGITEGWLSTIRNSPMYMQRRDDKWKELSARVMGSTADTITNEQVRKEARKHALEIVKGMANMAKDDESPFARLQAGREVLKVGQVVEEKRKTQLTVIEISDAWASRWDRAMGYDERSKPKGTAKISIKEEVSS